VIKKDNHSGHARKATFIARRSVCSRMVASVRIRRRRRLSVSNYVTYSCSLLFALTNSTTLSFILSFLYHQKKLASVKNNAKNNPKNDAKRALARKESKMAENNRLVAAGVGIDANLTPRMLKKIALRLKERIESIVPAGNMFYVLTSQTRLVETEAWPAQPGEVVAHPYSPCQMVTS